MKATSSGSSAPAPSRMSGVDPIYRSDLPVCVNGTPEVGALHLERRGEQHIMPSGCYRSRLGLVAVVLVS
jgi:hypothetical protein